MQDVEVLDAESRLLLVSCDLITWDPIKSLVRRVARRYDKQKIFNKKKIANIIAKDSSKYGAALTKWPSYSDSYSDFPWISLRMSMVFEFIPHYSVGSDHLIAI